MLTGDENVSCLRVVVPGVCLPEKLNHVIDRTEPVVFCGGVTATTANGKCIAGGDFADASSPRCMPKTKTKKIIYNVTENDDFDREEIPTYEEVIKLYPRPGLPRPLVLVGPPGIGRNELKRRLIALNPDKFRTPTPCEC